MPRRSAPMWYVLVTVMVSMLLVSGAGILYTNHVDAKREQAQAAALRGTCELYGVLYDATFRADLKALLRAAYVDAGCVPPIAQRTPLPSPTPTR